MEIVNIDALEYIAGFEDETFDLVILDPDYQDWEDLLKSGILSETIRVLKPTGNTLCFTKQPFDFALRNAVNPYFRREIVWTFDNGGAWVSTRMPLVSHQKVFWLTKGKDFFFTPRTGIAYSDATRDFKRKSKVFGDYEAEGRQFRKSEEGVWLRDHLHYNKPNSGKIPAKPQELIDIFVRCFSPVGGNVLDPFSGSGTTLDACDRLERECFASEIDEERAMSLIDKFMERASDEFCEMPRKGKRRSTEIEEEAQGELRIW